jgi:hypothetical protein
VLNVLRRENGGVLPNPVSSAQIRAALKELGREVNDYTVDIATKALAREGVTISANPMNNLESAQPSADFLIEAAQRGVPVTEALGMFVLGEEDDKKDDGGKRKSAEAMAKNAGKKPGDEDWEATVKKFMGNQKESTVKESFSAGDNDRLETEFVDKHGLAATVAALSDICLAKEEHLASNWQDDVTAKQWNRAGIMLQNLATKLPV